MLAIQETYVANDDVTNSWRPWDALPYRGDINHYVGDRIRRRRRELGLTQNELAKRISSNTVFQTIQKWETGVSCIQVDRLLSIANAMEVDITYFFGYNARIL